MNKKVFILLPDGIGLRNFVFTNFNDIGLNEGIDICYWNNTLFDLETVGLNEIKIENAKLHSFTDFYKRAKIQIELNNFIKKNEDQTYDLYRFPFKDKTLKSKVKNKITKFLIKVYNSEKGIFKLRKKINKLEVSTKYFEHCVSILKANKPAFVFSTNQRPALALAPILAAKKIGIPTGTFIFSWDNLPKATMIIETDYYFVWSLYMKKELLNYYPFIKESQIKITGSPQFEPHYNNELYVSKASFFEQYKLENDKKYICFSGDDITTSPNDHFYLEDVAKAIRKLNNKGHNLGIIYRKCPVDFSNRHLDVYNEYKDVIVLIDPLWTNLGNNWDTVMPLKEDLALLVNTVKNTEMVINVGSSMVFDFIAHHKPCAFLNYNTEKTVDKSWNIEKIYKFIHFKSMPSKESVLWIDTADKIEEIIIEGLKLNDLSATEEWFRKIGGESPKSASKKIWNEIKSIIS